MLKSHEPINGATAANQEVHSFDFSASPWRFSGEPKREQKCNNARNKSKIRISHKASPPNIGAGLQF